MEHPAAHSRRQRVVVGEKEPACQDGGDSHLYRETEQHDVADHPTDISGAQGLGLGLDDLADSQAHPSRQQHHDQRRQCHDAQTPAWISTTMTTSPNPDQKVAVSTMIRPVTHTAEVAVNKAVSRSGRFPSAVAIGNDSSSVPTITAPAQARAMTRPGCGNAPLGRDPVTPASTPATTEPHASTQRTP